MIDSTPTEGPEQNPPHAEPPIPPDGPGPPAASGESDDDGGFTVLQLGNAHTKKRKLIKLEGTLAGRPAVGLLDSGASGNFVSSSFIHAHGLTIASVANDGERRLRVTLADGSQQEARGMLQDAELVLGTYRDRISSVALPLSGYDFILGMPWLEKVQPHINWREKSVSFDHQGDKHVLHSIGSYQFMSAAELKRAVRKKQVTSVSVMKWDDRRLEVTAAAGTSAGHRDKPPSSHTLAAVAAVADADHDANPDQTSARASMLKSSAMSFQTNCLRDCHRVATSITRSSWYPAPRQPIVRRTA